MIAERAAVTRYVSAVVGFCAAFIAGLAGLSGILGAAGSSAFGGGTAALLVGAFVGAAATAAIAFAIVLVSQGAGAAPEREARARRPAARDVDLSTLVAQSHPDAAGHVRSRAPGDVLPAA